MRILLLTIGTRGDVQPFVALGRRLKQSGHDVALCTSSSFSSWVEQQGLEYRHLNNEFVELAQGEAGRKAMEEWGGWTGRLKWMAEATRLFKPIFRKTLKEEWEVAQDAQMIIYNPQSVGGFHMAEALGVPGIMADALPTRVPTGAFPNFTFPDLGLENSYNRLTYRLLPIMTGGMFGSIVKEWRRDTLKLPPRSMTKGELMRSDGRTVPVLYFFSRHVLSPPADWSELIYVTGYWVLDESKNWQPPPALLKFLESGPPPVFVGFGSTRRERHALCLKHSRKRASVGCWLKGGVGWRRNNCLTRVQSRECSLRLALSAYRLCRASRWRRNDGFRITSGKTDSDLPLCGRPALLRATIRRSPRCRPATDSAAQAHCRQPRRRNSADSHRYRNATARCRFRRKNPRRRWHRASRKFDREVCG